MKKILCVVRVSTTKQETESQHNDLVQFLRGKYSEDEIEWLEVAGASARKANPAYLQMLETIKSKILSNPDIKACAFWCLDRLGRIESYINLMKEWFIKNSIQVYVKQPSLTLLKDDGTLDAGANIAWSVFASMIAYNTEELMDKLQRGKEQNKKDGKWNGGNLSLGFKVNAEGYIVIDNEGMAIIKGIFEEYATGKWSVNKLWREYKSRGYSYSETMLNRTLRKEIYRDIIGAELFDKVQKIITNQALGIRSKESKYSHWAQKLIKCTCCNCNYIAFADRRYECFYKATNYRRDDKRDCKSPSISIKVMDTLLLDIAMMGYKWQLENIDMNSIEELQQKNNVLRLKVDTLKKELIKCQGKKERAVDLYANGDIGKIKYTALVSKANSDMELIEAETERLGQEIAFVTEQIDLAKNPDIQGWLDLCVKSTDTLPSNEIKELIHKYIKGVTLESVVVDGFDATKIYIVDMLDRTHSFLYYYSKGKSPIWTVKMQQILSDGTLIPYLRDKKYNSRTEAQRDLYLQAMQLHPNRE